MRRGLFVPLLVRSEVEDLSRRFEETLPLHRAAVRLGCGRLGVEQLSAMRLLGHEAPEVPITGCEPRVRSAGLSALVKRLERGSAEVGDDGVPLTEVFSGCGGVLKPVGPAVRAILRGDLAAQVASGVGPVFRRMTVARSDVAAIRALTFDRSRHPDHPFIDVVAKGEAGSELNLRAPQWVELLLQWRADGNMPVVPVAWLLETMAQGISVPEISKRLGRGGRYVNARLAKVRPRRIMPFLYDRIAVEAAWGELNH